SQKTSPLFYSCGVPPHPHSVPTRRSSDLPSACRAASLTAADRLNGPSSWCPSYTGQSGCSATQRSRTHDHTRSRRPPSQRRGTRSEEHTSELQSRENLVCRLLLEKKNAA